MVDIEVEPKKVFPEQAKGAFEMSGLDARLNILITSVGRRAYFVRYFKEAIGGRGLVHACNSIHAVGMEEADRSFITPQIYSEEYVDVIAEYCKSNSIDALLSLFDIDLLVLANNREKIEASGAKLILAPSEFVRACNDKFKTAAFFESIGLKSPKTFLGIGGAKAALQEGALDYPVVIKPRWGMGSQSVFLAENELELEVLSAKAKRNIQSSYLRFESALEDESLIYQEKLVGMEYGVDVINDLNGNLVGVYPKQKIAMRAGETDISLTVSPAPFEEIASKISSSSGHQGICSVDCLVVEGRSSIGCHHAACRPSIGCHHAACRPSIGDNPAACRLDAVDYPAVANEIYVLEMNCRVSGHYPFSHLAGVDYPRMLVSWLLGESPSDDCFKFEVGQYATKDLVPVTLSSECTR